jgi:hypothetical protein
MLSASATPINKLLVEDLGLPGVKLPFLSGSEEAAMLSRSGRYL